MEKVSGGGTIVGGMVIVGILETLTLSSWCRIYEVDYTGRGSIIK